MEPIIQTSILDLPEDCLIPIFMNLPIFDLLSVYESQKYFHEAAKHSFSLKYKRLCVKQYRQYTVYNINDTMSFMDRLSLAKLFETFGSCMKSLQLQSNLTTNMTSLLRLVNDCCAGSVKRLSINCSSIEGRKIIAFTNLYKHLETLEVVSGFDTATFERILIKCENLKDLIINVECLRPESFLPRIHSTLERIFFRMNKQLISHQTALSFILNHPNLKTLYISKVFVATNQCLDYLDNIEVLRVDMRATPRTLLDVSWRQLFQLVNLKHLDLVSNADIGRTLPNFTLKPVTKVEILALSFNYLKNVFEILDAFTFTNLKILIISCQSTEERYFEGINPLFVINVIKQLPNLEEVQFFYFPRNAFVNLMHIVEASDSLKTIVLLQRDINDDDKTQLMELLDTKKRLLQLTNPIKLVVGANFGEIWRHDYFFMHF